MLALAARSMGYRIAVLDPDPDCPAAAVADELVVGRLRRRRRRAAPGRAERRRDLRARARRGGRRRGGRRATSGPARPHAAARHAGPPGRAPLRRSRRRRRRALAGGPDRPTTSGRAAATSACRCGSRSRSAATTAAARSGSRDAAEIDGALESLGRPAGEPLLAERELAFDVGGIDHRRPRHRWRDRRLPVARNVHDAGILVEIGGARPGPDRVAERAAAARGAAGGGDGPGRHPDRRAVPPARRQPRRQRARAAGPQQRPLDDRGRRDLAVRAAHPGDLRPGLGATDALAPTAMVNLLGTGPRRARRGWTPTASPPPSPTRPSICTCTTSGGSSNAGRWGT